MQSRLSKPYYHCQQASKNFQKKWEERNSPICRRGNQFRGTFDEERRTTPREFENRDSSMLIGRNALEKGQEFLESCFRIRHWSADSRNRLQKEEIFAGNYPAASSCAGGLASGERLKFRY
ncbi:hypothetical protein AVEN_98202-1 [Araneus ventricosus]|uniref:Uncharacterized protein n=1 Tax=Araneus ventricosus TaxID=182803 RepID=A0A4Y2LNJ9_ARAVE|nr:hypothetical protein AVEN_98202-1 [Araneus ventricosus]